MKKTEKAFNISCYKYASEQLNININGELISLTHQTRSHLGYLFLTNEQKFWQEFKQLIRKKLNKPTKKILALKTTDNGYLHLQNIKVDPYNIKEKLNIYKELKKQATEEEYLTVEKGQIIPGQKTKTEKEFVKFNIKGVTLV